MGLLNPLTGESELDGIRYIFTADAWLAIETQLGVTTLRLLSSAANMDIGFREAQAMIHAGSEAHRRRFAPQARPVSPERVLDAIGDAGLLNVATDLAAAIQGSTALGAGSDGGSGEAAPFSTGPTS